jgi:hypothetical protein
MVVCIIVRGSVNQPFVFVEVEVKSTVCRGTETVTTIGYLNEFLLLFVSINVSAG